MKKLLLILSMALLLACVFAFSVNAENTINGSVSNEYGTLTIIDGVAEPSVLDKNAKAVVKVGDLYYTIPTYYLIKDNATFTWSVPTVVRDNLGLTLSQDKDIRSYVVRIEIPENVTALQNHENAFRIGGSNKNTTLIAVAFPSTLTDLGIGSFNQCATLTSVDLTNTKITVLRSETTATHNNNSGVFSSCSALTSIKLPSTITRIEKWAATTCSSLAEVVIPADAKINHIGQYAFEKSVITTFYFSSELTELGIGAFFECKKLATLENFENTKLESVPYRAFSTTALTSLYLPSTLNSIGEDAFKSHYIKQDSLIIPNSVTAIGKCAFAGSSRDNVSINSLVLPANLTTLSTYAFEKNSAKVIYFPASVTSVPEGMFKDFADTFLFVFVGTKEQLDALIPNINNTNNYNGRLSIDAAKTIKAISEYGKIDPSAVSGKSMVYGVNHCDAFYGGAHSLGTITPVFEGGKLISSCKLTSSCSREQCTSESVVVKTLAPLFSFAGFSVSEYSSAVMQSFSVNRAELSSYKDVLGDLSYGLIAALEDADPTDDEAGRFNGELYTDGAFKEKVLSIDFTGRTYDIIEMKIGGLSDNESALIYCCAYVIIDGEITYLHNKTASDTATYFSYNEIA